MFVDFHFHKIPTGPLKNKQTKKQKTKTFFLFFSFLFAHKPNIQASIRHYYSRLEQ